MSISRLLLALSVAGASLTVVAGPADAAGPGDVISAQPTTFFLDPFKATRANADAWHVLYRSTSATGQTNAVSGTVLVPRTPFAGARPIVGYAVGTHGLGDQCAPSKLMASGTENEEALINTALLNGWAVAVTDYEGLGTPGDHTYAVGRAEGLALLDAVRAATHLPGLSPAAPVGIMGYSQGGQAAAWAGQLQPTYAPELRLAGVAAGGVPADMLRVARSNDGGVGSGLVIMAATGYDAAYPELNLSSFLNATGKAAAADVRDDCVAEATAKYAFRRIADVTTADPLSTPAWQARLVENTLGRTAPTAPVFLYQSVLDELIPYPMALELRRAWCAAGVRVQWKEFLVSEHISGAVFGFPFAASWLADRFAHRPVPTNC